MLVHSNGGQNVQTSILNSQLQLSKCILVLMNLIIDN